MKRIHILFVSILALSTTFIVYSCNKTSSAPVARQSFSEDQVFEGVMFGQGAVAKLLPQVSKTQIQPEEVFTKQADIEQVYSTRRKIMNSIKETNPGFFAEFKADMTSGDPERITKAYKMAAQKVYTGLLTINHITSREQESNFIRKIESANQKFASLKSDGTIDKDNTVVKLKTIAMDSKLDDGTADPASDECVTIAVAVAGTVVFVVVAVGAVVYAAAATDAYAWVTSSEASAFSGEVDNKTPLVVEELVGQIAVTL
jgi:hypothetical protein